MSEPLRSGPGAGPPAIVALDTSAGPLPLPAFLPDATRGVVRCLDAADLRTAGVRAVMVNSFHVARRPGARLVQRLGGLHRFMAWTGPIVTDSGGYQVLSMIRRDPRCGTVRPDGVIFRDPEDGSKVILTPEKSVQLQLNLGANVLIALDDCTGIASSGDDERHSVERTIRWFRSARLELDRQHEQRRLPGKPPPLVGVVQGGANAGLRRECTQALLDLGADAIGFGGWPIDEEGQLLFELFSLVAQAVPPQKAMFALGIGKPEHLVSIARLGRRFVFDCSLPTRDARHHRLYVWRDGALPPDDARFYDHLYMLDAKHALSDAPLSEACDCPCCRSYSRAYLHHLFKIKDSLAERMATLHNIRFYSQLIERLSSNG